MTEIARVLPESGRQAVAGVTLAWTECCQAQVQLVIVEPEREREPVLAAWFDGDGKQATACTCGRALPPGERWNQ